MSVARLQAKASTVAHLSRTQAPKILALEGSVRSSKTVVTLLLWAAYIRVAPPGLLLMTGRTERTIRDNLIYPMQEWFGKDRVVYRAGTGIATIFGRDVLVVGANNEAARTKIQGLTLAGAYVDEASTLPESYFNMLYSRLSVVGARLFLTSNPEGPRHWLKIRWLDRAKTWVRKDASIDHKPGGLDLTRATFVLEDNTWLVANNPGYITDLKATYTGLWRRRYIDAEWVVAEGAIYETWNPAVDVVRPDELPPMERVLSLGADYGTTNPTAGILLGVAEGKLWALDEWAPAKATDAQLSAGLTRWLGHRPVPSWRDPEWLFIDPAAASFKLQLHTDGLSNVGNGANQVLPGIRVVSSLLALGLLKVSASCTNLIDELPGYSWDPKATEKGQDVPVKVDDHFCDALRYAVHTSQAVWHAYIPINLAALGDTTELEEVA